MPLRVSPIALASLAGSLLAATAHAESPASAPAWQALPPIPIPLGVAAPFAAVSNGTLIVAGGANFPDAPPWLGGQKVWHSAIWSLASPSAQWQPAGNLPAPLAYGVSLSINGLFLAIGGSDSSRHHNSVLAFSWRDGKLLPSDVNPGPLPIPLALAAGAVDPDQNAFVACGSESPGEQSASNRVFTARFHGESPRWRELPPLPAAPRILPVAAADHHAFYLFGGAALETKNGKISRRYLRDAWRYSPASGWQQLADLPFPSAAAPSPAPLQHGIIHILGGDDGSLAGFSPPDKHPGFPGRLLQYHIATNTWSVSGTMPSPRVTAPCTPFASGFAIPSGESRPGVRSPKVDLFSPAPPP